jgi:hypothetical protein
MDTKAAADTTVEGSQDTSFQFSMDDQVSYEETVGINVLYAKVFSAPSAKASNTIVSSTTGTIHMAGSDRLFRGNMLMVSYWRHGGARKLSSWRTTITANNMPHGQYTIAFFDNKGDRTNRGHLLQRAQSLQGACNRKPRHW